uniref:Biogenesis of lysosome-related organelles complex 1 subunit 7 n=1 Tax=Cuerna arida TaxID=1464854 RepID=A0A1B6FT46_9HEMI
MDGETISTNTSVDDKTEDFCENPTRDTLAEGLMCLLKPTIDQLDERVRATRISQLELKQQIEDLSEELKKISAEQSCPLALESYTNKLTNTRHKITVISNILQTAQERLHKIQSLGKLETERVKTLMEPAASPSTVESAPQQ